MVNIQLDMLKRSLSWGDLGGPTEPQLISFGHCLVLMFNPTAFKPDPKIKLSWIYRCQHYSDKPKSDFSIYESGSIQRGMIAVSPN